MSGEATAHVGACQGDTDCNGCLPSLDDLASNAVPSDDYLLAEQWSIATCTQREAVSFIESTHYSMGAPNTSVARHALYRLDNPDKIRGIALWLPPTKPAAESVNRDNWRGVLSLSRLCVADEVPRNGASYLLGRSMRLIDRAKWPTLLTYADTAYGHTGAIYLATNWTRIGLVKGSDAWVTATGERRGRKRGGRNLSSQDMRDAGFLRLPTRPKVKFVHNLEGRRDERGQRMPTSESKCWCNPVAVLHAPECPARVCPDCHKRRGEPAGFGCVLLHRPMSAPARPTK